MLTEGAIVPVRVDDQAQLLEANEGKTPGAHLLMGVATDSGFFQTFALVSKDGAGRNYQLLIPFDRDLKVFAGSGFFQMSDELPGRKIGPPWAEVRPNPPSAFSPFPTIFKNSKDREPI